MYYNLDNLSTNIYVEDSTFNIVSFQEHIDKKYVYINYNT